MLQARRTMLVAALLIPMMGLVAAHDRLMGQQPEPAQEAASEKVRKKPRGRLPAYYGRVVSQEQREEIYAIQASYAKQIEELQQELRALRAKQDMEIKAVLTPQQQEKVAALIEEARAKRAARTEKPDSSSSDEGDSDN